MDSTHHTNGRHQGGVRRRIGATALAAGVIGVTVASCGGSDDDAQEAADCTVGFTDGDLAMYNWSEYIDPEQIAEFETTFGVSVTEDTYDSNEAMQAVVAQGNSGYDLVVPSDYMVGIMADAGNLQPLVTDALPNLSNLAEDFTGLDFDPDNTWSVPYQVGTTGLAVDTSVVGTDFPRSWSLVFDPAVADAFAGQITLLNDARETLGAALTYL